MMRRRVFFILLVLVGVVLIVLGVKSGMLAVIHSFASQI